jgi:hypothetical protein
LSNTQRKALAAVLCGKANEINAIARSEGVMTEVLIDSINNLALDYIGDNILEETDAGLNIFEDYTDELLKGRRSV